jgi:hypothetical protein
MRFLFFISLLLFSFISFSASYDQDTNTIYSDFGHCKLFAFKVKSSRTAKILKEKGWEFTTQVNLGSSAKRIGLTVLAGLAGPRNAVNQYYDVNIEEYNTKFLPRAFSTEPQFVLFFSSYKVTGKKDYRSIFNNLVEVITPSPVEVYNSNLEIEDQPSIEYSIFDLPLPNHVSQQSYAKSEETLLKNFPNCVVTKY